MTITKYNQPHIKDPVLKQVQDYKDLKSFLYKVRDDNVHVWRNNQTTS